jgi:hypothetical protein
MSVFGRRAGARILLEFDGDHALRIRSEMRGDRYVGDGSAGRAHDHEVLGVCEVALGVREVATEPGRAGEAVGEIVGALAERDIRWGDGAGDVEAPAASVLSWNNETASPEVTV